MCEMRSVTERNALMPYALVAERNALYRDDYEYSLDVKKCK
jgi:hypothetical protein